MVPRTDASTSTSLTTPSRFFVAPRATSTEGPESPPLPVSPAGGGQDHVLVARPERGHDDVTGTTVVGGGEGGQAGDEGPEGGRFVSSLLPLWA